MSFEVSGKIIAVLDKKSGVSNSTGNPWIAQQYVIETQEQYPKRLCFEAFGEDRIASFNIQEGENITVSFDIDAREYQGRWYNSFRAWKVERANPVQDVQVQDVQVQNETGDDLSFLDDPFGSKDDLPPF